MLDFLKRNKKEKELQAAREEAKLAEQQRKEEEKSKLREQQAKIAKHAEGGEKIRRALRNIDLENYEMLAEQKESKLSTGSIEQYIRVIDKIEQVLDDATISDVDTTEIDDDLVQLVALFAIALESGNEKQRPNFSKELQRVLNLQEPRSFIQTKNRDRRSHGGEEKTSMYCFCLEDARNMWTVYRSHLKSWRHTAKSLIPKKRNLNSEQKKCCRTIPCSMTKLQESK